MAGVIDRHLDQRVVEVEVDVADERVGRGRRASGLRGRRSHGGVRREGRRRLLTRLAEPGAGLAGVEDPAQLGAPLLGQQRARAPLADLLRSLAQRVDVDVDVHLVVGRRRDRLRQTRGPSPDHLRVGPGPRGRVLGRRRLGARGAHARQVRAGLHPRRRRCIALREHHGGAQLGLAGRARGLGLLGQLRQHVLHDHAHDVRARPARLGIEGQRAVDDLDHRPRQARTDAGDRARRLACDGQQAIDDRPGRWVHGLAGEATKHRRRDRPEVAARVEVLVVGPRLLRCDVRDRAEHDAVALIHRLGRQLADPCETEVEELHGAVTRQVDVPRLDVAMQDALGVGVREHFEQLVRQLEHFRGAQHPHSLQTSLERLAVEQLHHEVDLAVLGGIVVEHQHRVAVADLVGRVALGEEATSRLLVARVLGMQQLDRSARAVTMRAGVHGRHATDGDQ